MVEKARNLVFRPKSELQRRASRLISSKKAGGWSGPDPAALKRPFLLWGFRSLVLELPRSLVAVGPDVLPPRRVPQGRSAKRGMGLALREGGSVDSPSGVQSDFTHACTGGRVALGRRSGMHLGTGQPVLVVVRRGSRRPTDSPFVVLEVPRSLVPVGASVVLRGFPP